MLHLRPALLIASLALSFFASPLSIHNAKADGDPDPCLFIFNKQSTNSVHHHIEQWIAAEISANRLTTENLYSALVPKTKGTWRTVRPNPKLFNQFAQQWKLVPKAETFWQRFNLTEIDFTEYVSSNFLEQINDEQATQSQKIIRLWYAIRQAHFAPKTKSDVIQILDLALFGTKRINPATATPEQILEGYQEVRGYLISQGVTNQKVQIETLTWYFGKWDTSKIGEQILQPALTAYLSTPPIAPENGMSLLNWMERTQFKAVSKLVIPDKPNTHALANLSWVILQQTPKQSHATESLISYFVQHHTPRKNYRSNPLHPISTTL
jgi:hypothetical protein